MAKVKIQGHASGTGILTVTAPNTSTDRTITLPDATGTLTFTPSITDNGNATAITIDSSENIIVTGDVTASGGSFLLNVDNFLQFSDDSFARIVVNDTEIFRAVSDGRGLSQFTAKAWIRFNGTGTAAITDSHNCSSLQDSGTGDYKVNLSNDLANANYCITAMGNYAQGGSKAPIIHQRGNVLVGSFEVRCTEAGTTYTNMDTGVHAIAFGD